MKKSLLVSAAALALAAAATVAPMTVSAATADGSAQGTTTAEFTVTAGDDGSTTPGGDNGSGVNKDLWLVNAPDMNFGTTTVAKIIAGTAAMNYQTGTVNAITKDAAENADGKLAVSDLRGNGAGWKHSANLTQFTNNADKTDANKLNGQIALALTNVDAPNATLGTAATLKTDGQDVTIWTAGKDEGQGANTADVDTATKLTLDKNAQVKAVQYDATITWTLSSTITAG